MVTRESPSATTRKQAKQVAPPAAASRPRDPRLPPVGAVLGRMYNGERHDVRMLEAGFEYQGRVFGSLSQVARAITGTGWNGFGFFGLGAPTDEVHTNEKAGHEPRRMKRSA
jgi:hypothetical protein